MKSTLLLLPIIDNQIACTEENGVRVEGTIVAVGGIKKMVAGLNVELENFDANGWTNTHTVLVEVGAHAEVHSVSESKGIFFVPESEVVA